jgi:hypothetical protein
LREIYDQFSEGFETADLQAANALLKSLAPNCNPRLSEAIPQETPIDASAA